MTTFNALHLSRGWLSVALASAHDKDRPILNRTVSVETFPEGVRLAATDTYMLLTAWVPSLDHEDDPEPSPDETPVSTAVAIDTDGRARSFMQYLHTTSTAKDAEVPDMWLNVGTLPADSVPGATASFEGMEARWVTLELPARERVTLRTYEGVDYPNWRKLLSGFKGTRTDAIALHPDRLAALSKLGKIHDSFALVWRFGGRERPARLELGDSFPHVEGLVMPVRWDLDRDAPAVDDDAS